MSATELAEWQAYDAIEPIGSRPDRQMLAQISNMIYWANADPKKAPKLTVDDFDYSLSPKDLELRHEHRQRTDADAIVAKLKKEFPERPGTKG